MVAIGGTQPLAVTANVEVNFNYTNSCIKFENGKVVKTFRALLFPSLHELAAIQKDIVCLFRIYEIPV